MGSRLEVSNSPLFTLLEEETDRLQVRHSLPASCLPFLRQETSGLHAPYL